MSNVLTRQRRRHVPAPGTYDHELFRHDYAPTLADRAARRTAQQRFRSLVVYAKLLGFRWNVRIVFDPGTTTAKTNGEVIYLRPLQIGDESDAVLMECLIDHEAGVHCRQTDFLLMQRRFVNAPELLTTLHNVFEDVWGERELKKVKPGCARSIAAGLQIMVDRGIFGPPKEGAHIASLLVGGLVNGLRSRKLGQTMLEPFFIQRWGKLEEHFGRDLTEKIWQEAQKVDNCFDTGAAIDLAESIMQMLRDFLSQEPPTLPPLPRQGDGSDSGEDGTGEPNPDKGDGDPRKSPQSEGQPSHPDEGDNSTGASSKNDGSSTGQAGDEDDGGDTPSGGQSSSSDDKNGDDPSAGNGQESSGQQEGSNGSGYDGKPDVAGNPPASSGSAGNDSSQGEPGSQSKGGEGSQGAQPSQGDDQGSSDAGSGHQARSRRSGESTTNPGSGNGNPQGNSQPGPSDPSGAPEQAPIQSNGAGGDDPQSTVAPGTAAPQPAPMTPEQFHDALKAVISTIKATRNESGSGELADAVADALNASTATAQAATAGISAGNIWHELDSSQLAENDAVDQIVAETARPIALRLGSRLDALLEAKVTSNSYLKSHGGRRMDSGRLVRMQVSGNQRVYRASDDIEDIATAVHVLTDISASMNAGLERAQPEPKSPAQAKKVDQQKQAARPTIGSSRIGAAAAVSRALGDIFHRFDVPFALSYFGSCLTKVKGFDDNWRRKRNVYWTRLEGSTCTDQALIGIIPELAFRDEERKLLVLVSDGVPAHAQATALALSEARKLGIDVCVVLVTSDDQHSNVILNAFKAELDKWDIPHATATVFEELAQAVFNAVKAAF